MTAPKTFSEIEVECALCLWEEVMDKRDHSGVSAAFDRVGSWAMRHAIMALVPDCERVWQALGDDNDGVTFDWEYIPFYLGHCVDWDTVTALPDDECLRMLREEFVGNDKAAQGAAY